MTCLYRQAQFLTSAFQLSQLYPDEGLEIAFAGRSNAGKSTAINRLARQKSLCKTSKTPGRTQLINFFQLDEQRRLVDLPGYGFAKVPKKIRQHWGQVLSRYLLERQSLQGLIIVVDIRRGLTELDWGLIEMVNRNLPLHILLTKADKLSRSAVRKAASGVERCLPGPRHSLSTLSIVDRRGLESLQQRCRSWLEIEAVC